MYRPQLSTFHSFSIRDCISIHQILFNCSL